MGGGSSRAPPRRSISLVTALILAGLCCVRAPLVADEQSDELTRKRTCGCTFEAPSAGEAAVEILIEPADAASRAGENGAVEQDRQALSVLFAALDLEDLQGCTLSFWIDCQVVLLDGPAWEQVFPCATRLTPTCGSELTVTTF